MSVRALRASSRCRADHDRINQARNDLSDALQQMRGVTAQARTATKQRVRLLQAAGGGLLAGILIWSFLLGTIARTMPASWHWPERMAAHIVDQPTIVDAGVHLIRSANPSAWTEISTAAAILRGNRTTLQRCKNAARKAKRAVKCEIRVEA
jgi:hypothetical protein